MCCGNRRANAVATLAHGIGQQPRGVPQARPERPQVRFEYTGQTSLAVIGNITGATYRFPAPGAIVPVDGRDAAAVSGVPNVRRTAR
jgi:hypothetical protein